MKEETSIIRPRWHFAPKQGWMNDPNGLIWFRGEYHLYFQHNPHSNCWDKMHWGHAVSQDLIHWKECQPVLIPEEEYEDDPRGGCFSGSILAYEGSLYAFYTAVSRDKESGEICSVQCLACSEDGYHFEKHKQNPLISESPSGNSDFRDPKVVFYKNQWQMLVGGASKGASDLTSRGRIYLYHSSDLIHWDYDGILYEGADGEGTMFECPDLFEIAGKWVLTYSPMYRTDFAPTVYMVGELSFESCLFCKESSGYLDFGPHYYASQAYRDRSGRMISLAWLGGWEWMPWIRDHGPSEEGGYRGVMASPRQLSLTEDHRLQIEAKAPEAERGGACVKRLSSDHSLLLAELDAREESLRISGRISRQSTVQSITMMLCDDADHSISITLDFLFGNIIRDYSRADSWSDFGLKVYPAPIGEVKDIPFDIIYDGNVLEIFFLGGQYNVSSMLYPNEGRLQFLIRSHGSACQLYWTDRRERSGLTEENA